MTKHELVLDFIWQFRKFGSDVADAFSNGMCFHFTTILRHRFGCGWCTIMYDQVANHFATQIEGRLYDITGDITDDPEYHWERWSDVRKKDPALAKIIRRDCILKIPDDQRSCELCAHCFYDEILGTFLCDKDNLPVDTYGVCRREDYK